MNLSKPDLLALVFILYAFLLILLPEWIYIDDIYKPDYYRANTLFKFYYQAWVLLSIATSYALVRILVWARKTKAISGYLFLFFFATILLPSVLFYTRFALDSSTGGAARSYKGLNGTAWLATSMPGDSSAINWLNNTIQGQPVLVEAVGDSYTDYSRISANTGLPTIMGWPVHEWLWRGSFSNPMRPKTKIQQLAEEENGAGIPSDTVSQRVADVGQIYESNDIELTKTLLTKYSAAYVYVGKLEQEKYPKLVVEKFNELGQVVYKNSDVVIFKIAH